MMLNSEMANGFNISFNKTLQVAWQLVLDPVLCTKHIQGYHFEMTDWIAHMFTTKFVHY